MSPLSVDFATCARDADAAWETLFRSRFAEMMDGPYATGIKERAQALKLEFIALEKHTTLAKQRWNACMGACGLPVEILANISAFAKVDWLPCLARGRKGYDLGWIYITHVCHAWRSAAIGSAHLWRDLYILTLPPKMATDMLRRARRLPLSVHVHHQQHEGYNEFQSHTSLPNWLCKPILPRIEQLSIFASNEEFDCWMSAFAHPMPAVRDLYINLFDWDTADSVHLLGDEFLGGQPMTSLSRLTLNNIALPNTSHLFSNALTFLSLSASLETELERGIPSTSTFRSQLQLMPNLEELRLRNIMPQPVSSVTVEPYIFPSVFKKLHVYISDPSLFAFSYLDFWTQFRTRSTTTVVAVVSSDEDSLPAARKVAAVLTYVNMRGPQPKELWIAQVAMRLSYAERPREEWSTRWDPSVSPGDYASMEDWGIDSREGRRVYTGCALASAYNSPKALYAVRAINFSATAVQAFNDSDDSAGLWLTKFSQNRAVRRIAVPYVKCGKLFNALALRDEDEEGPPLKLFPVLETIVLYDKEEYGEREQLHTALDMTFLDMLDLRRELGVPVKQLLVSRSIADWRVWANVGEGASVTFFD